MRHRVAHRKLNRTTAHRRSLRRSLVSSLIEHESIVTTVPKAKAVKAFAEKLITLAKRDTLAARRRAIAMLNERRIADEDSEHKTVISKLFSVLGPRFVDRPGGYTRIVRLSQRRLGDGTTKAVLQFVDQAIASTGVRARKTTKSGQAKPSPSKSSSSKAAAPVVEVAAETVPAEPVVDVANGDSGQSSPQDAKAPEADSSTEQKQADETKE